MIQLDFVKLFFGHFSMKKHFKILFAIFSLIPFVAHASIKFTVTNVKNSSHEGHRVKTPMIINDNSNNETVLSVGYPENLSKGLSSG